MVSGSLYIVNIDDHRTNELTYALSMYAHVYSYASLRIPDGRANREELKNKGKEKKIFVGESSN